LNPPAAFAAVKAFEIWASLKDLPLAMLRAKASILAVLAITISVVQSVIVKDSVLSTY
jgi:hypothetical protein